MLSYSTRSNNYAHPTRKPILGRVVLAACATAALVCALGVSSAQADRYVYWSTGAQTGYVARANIDGTAASTTFLSAGPGSGLPAGVAVTASKIFWRDGSLNGSGTLFTANLDASGSAALSVTASGLGTTNDSVTPMLGGRELGGRGLQRLAQPLRQTLTTTTTPASTAQPVGARRLGASPSMEPA